MEAYVAAARAEGWTMTLEQAIAYALDERLSPAKDPQERVSALRSQPQSNAKTHDDVRMATTRIKLVVPLW